MCGLVSLGSGSPSTQTGGTTHTKKKVKGRSAESTATQQIFLGRWMEEPQDNYTEYYSSPKEKVVHSQKVVNDPIPLYEVPKATTSTERAVRWPGSRGRE